MVDNVALQVKPLEIAPNTGFVNSLLAASQIRNADTQNQLAQFGLQEHQDEKNALANYSQRNAANDPNSLDALSSHPKLMGQMAQVRGSLDAQRRERFDFETTNKGRAAAAVLSLPPDQQEAAFKEQLENGLRGGWLTPDGYKQALSKPFNALALRQIALNGMTADKILANEQSQQDKADFREGIKGLNPEPQPATVASTGGGNSLGGIPGFAPGERFLGNEPPAGPAVAPVASPAAAGGSPATPAPAAPLLPDRNPMDPFARSLMQTAIVAPESAKPLLKSILDQHLKNSEPTGDIKEYRVAVQQGFKGPFTDWLKDIKKAGATSINTAEGLDAAQTKGRIAIDQAAIKDMAEKVSKSGSAIPLLQHVLTISKSTPAGYAGAMAPMVAKAAATLGIPVTEGMSNAELFNSITRQLVPGVRDPGSASNLEQQMYMAALPNASQSAEGREKIAHMFIKMQQRDQDVVNLYRNNLGSPDLTQKIKELSDKPLFAPEDMQWLELNAKAADLKQPPPQMNKTSTGVQWSIGR